MSGCSTGSICLQPLVRRSSTSPGRHTLWCSRNVEHPVSSPRRTRSTLCSRRSRRRRNCRTMMNSRGSPSRHRCPYPWHRCPGRCTPRRTRSTLRSRRSRRRRNCRTKMNSRGSPSRHRSYCPWHRCPGRCRPAAARERAAAGRRRRRSRGSRSQGSKTCPSCMQCSSSSSSRSPFGYSSNRSPYCRCKTRCSSTMHRLARARGARSRGSSGASNSPATANRGTPAQHVRAPRMAGLRRRAPTAPERASGRAEGGVGECVRVQAARPQPWGRTAAGVWRLVAGARERRLLSWRAWSHLADRQKGRE